MECKCKLCERDNYLKQDIHENYAHITFDRLAVLEKDHLAMQKLRTFPSIVVWNSKGNRYDILVGIPPQFHQDITDAILSVKEE